MTSWKPIEDAPKDGRSVLLWARLKTIPAEQDDIGYPIVGFWLRDIGWKVAPEFLNALTTSTLTRASAPTPVSALTHFFKTKA